jgi:hypothetical protein
MLSSWEWSVYIIIYYQNHTFNSTVNIVKCASGYSNANEKKLFHPILYKESRIFFDKLSYYKLFKYVLHHGMSEWVSK